MVDGVEGRLPSEGSGSLAARFWPYVDRSAGREGCWPWTRWCDEDGYGIVCIGSHRYRAHRVAWSLTQGPIPSDKLVLHHCDNPPCCNPGHHYLGTYGDNQSDTMLEDAAACSWPVGPKRPGRCACRSATTVQPRATTARPCQERAVP